MRYICLLVLVLTLAVLTNYVCSKYIPKSTFRHGHNTLIVGGQAARQGQFPYQLQITYQDSHHCGASLIEIDGFQAAVTAAHCMLYMPWDLKLVAGEIDLDVDSGYKQTAQVVFHWPHQNYSGQLGNWNDIAVVFFNNSFALNENVQPIRFPEQWEPTTGNITVAGWGRLSFGGIKPNLLQYVEIPVVNNEECLAAWNSYPDSRFDSVIIPSHICAGETSGTVSPCHGDSGGAAVDSEGKFVGIVSWGEECGTSLYPAVFTRTSHYVNWIRETVNLYKAMMNITMLTKS